MLSSSSESVTSHGSKHCYVLLPMMLTFQIPFVFHLRLIYILRVIFIYIFMNLLSLVLWIITKYYHIYFVVQIVSCYFSMVSAFFNMYNYTYIQTYVYTYTQMYIIYNKSMPFIIQCIQIPIYAHNQIHKYRHLFVWLSIHSYIL